MATVLIEDIPTARFNAVLKCMRAEGWKKTYEYDAFDAWIDYGEVRLTRDNQQITFKWDNWTEGEISGPSEIIGALREQHDL